MTSKIPIIFLNRVVNVLNVIPSAFHNQSDKMDNIDGTNIYSYLKKL